MIKIIEKTMREQGIDVFGTSNCSSVVKEGLRETPYAITIGVRLSDAVVDRIDEGPTKMYFHHYRSINAHLDACSLKCVIMLQREGYEALAVPASQTTNSAAIAGDFPHKTAASLAGLGFVGKSGLFVTTQFGPRIRFATVLTNMPLTSKPVIESQCADCRACVSACPCGAIVGSEFKAGMQREEVVDAELCSRYMKDKFQHIGRGSVCGICMAVCPFGQSTSLKHNS